MRELRELSNLPADQAYWVELEARVRGGGAAGRRGSNTPEWWAPLATRAGALVGLAAAAGIAALLLVPPRVRGGAANPTVLFRLPEDPAMAAFLSSPAPPSLGSLLSLPTRNAP
jgi:hypothetical protein